MVVTTTVVRSGTRTSNSRREEHTETDTDKAKCPVSIPQQQRCKSWYSGGSTDLLNAGLVGWLGAYVPPSLFSGILSLSQLHCISSHSSSIYEGVRARYTARYDTLGTPFETAASAF